MQLSFNGRINVQFSLFSHFFFPLDFRVRNKGNYDFFFCQGNVCKSIKCQANRFIIYLLTYWILNEDCEQRKYDDYKV